MKLKIGRGDLKHLVPAASGSLSPFPAAPASLTSPLPSPDVIFRAYHPSISPSLVTNPNLPSPTLSPSLVPLLEPEDEPEPQLDLNDPLEPKEPEPDLTDHVEPEETEPDLNPFANFPLGTFPSDLICWIERRACSLPTLAKYHSIG